MEISKFDHNYVLTVHPEPPVQDVLMLFQHDPEIVEEDVIIYKDYGLAERLPNTEIPEDIQNYVHDQEMKITVPKSPLNSTEIDITNPLTAYEWKLWYDLIVATKGHGFVQILPVGYRSNQAFKNNLLHVLPKKQKGWGDFRIPIDSLIEIREEYYKKENKRLFDESQKRKDKESKQESDPLAQLEKQQQDEKQREEDLKNEHIYKYSKKNIFRLPEYDFPHCVCILDSKPSDNSLVTDFMKISEELDLENLRNLGVTILLNERWMFAAPLSKPYLVMENGLELFVDPFSYGGIMNIHIKKHEWPQTAGIDVEDNILAYLPSKEYSEPQPHQLPEEEQPVEFSEQDDRQGEDDDKEGEGEGDNDE